MDDLGISYPKASIHGCPEEIRRIIFLSLAKSDLKLLCQTHSQLRASAEPCLYSEIDLKWHDDGICHITTLLGSILRRPDLASHVRSLTLKRESCGIYYHPMKPKKLLVAKSDLEACLTFFQKRRIPHPKAHTRELRRRSMDAFVALLLLQPMPLTQLTICGRYLEQSRLTNAVLSATCLKRSAALTPHDHRGLRSVTLHENVPIFGDPSPGDLSAALSLFYLPSIEHLSLAMDQSAEISWPQPHPPLCSSLRSLNIMMMRETCLDQILIVTPRLQSFAWKRIHNAVLNETRYPPFIDLDSLMRALSHVRTTLQHLSLSVRDLGYTDAPPLTLRGNLEGLKMLTGLKSLQIPLYCFIGAPGNPRIHMEDALSPAIDALTLTDDLRDDADIWWEFADLIAFLTPWLERLRAQTTRLRVIEIDFKGMIESGDVSHCRRIRDLYIDAGIVLKVPIRRRRSSVIG